MTEAAYVLIINTSCGDQVAVRFPNAIAARNWEDDHEMEVGAAIGCIRIVSKACALDLATERKTA